MECGATAALLTTALREAYIVVINKVYTGEISTNDIESGAVKDELSNILKDKAQKEI